MQKHQPTALQSAQARYEVEKTWGEHWWKGQRGRNAFGLMLKYGQWVHYMSPPTGGSEHVDLWAARMLFKGDDILCWLILVRFSLQPTGHSLSFDEMKLH